MLSEGFRQVIRATLPAVGAAIGEITPLFYRKMFAAHPELERDLFNRGNQKQGDQQRALAASIAGFATLQKRAAALLVPPDSLFLARRVHLVGLTLRHAVPVLFPWREAVEIGGLMSYGPSFPDGYRQVGLYTGRILKGEKPGDLPVLRPSKFELIINLQTAKTLGLDVAPTLLGSADEVIE